MPDLILSSAIDSFLSQTLTDSGQKATILSSIGGISIAGIDMIKKEGGGVVVIGESNPTAGDPNTGYDTLISGYANTGNSGGGCSISGSGNSGNLAGNCSISGFANVGNSGGGCSISGSNNADIFDPIEAYIL